MLWTFSERHIKYKLGRNLTKNMRCWFPLKKETGEVGEHRGNTISHILRRPLDFLNGKQTKTSKGHILSFMVTEYRPLVRTVRPENISLQLLKSTYCTQVISVSCYFCHKIYSTCKYKFTPIHTLWRH